MKSLHRGISLIGTPEPVRVPPSTVIDGDPIAMIRETLGANPAIGALVLGAAISGSPGPLVMHFAGDAGALPCPLMIVPGSLSVDELDRLS